MEYTRVLPRDLFNEAKLLKCIGRLCLNIHDELTPVKMSFEHQGNSFDIQMMPDGSLVVSNIFVSIKGEELLFKTIYNSKSNYPFYAEHDSCDYLVFDDQGNWDEEFIRLCNSL